MIMNKVSVSDVNFKGRRALVRVDFNVPMDDNQKISDDRRIKASVPSIQKIMNDGGKVILCSHLGRPKGKMVETLSLKPVAIRLSEILGREVTFAEDCIGPEASNPVDKMEEGDCLLLENLRFHSEEESNSADFSRKLAALADIFVNDAFGTAHRAHASIEGVTHFFRQSVAGFLMENEIKFLGNTVSNPVRPFAAIIGGAKISGKIEVIESLIEKVDMLLIGGGMTFTFTRAIGHSTGKSLVEEDKIPLAKEIIDRCQRNGKELIFPVDVVVAEEATGTAHTEVVDIDKIQENMIGLDIGPKTAALFKEKLKDASTIIWNGPMGVFEIDQFASGTKAIAKILAELTSTGATTIVGGGDSAAAVSKANLNEKISHISTGGGASLEFLEGKLLPGIESLSNRTSPMSISTVIV